VIGGAVLIATVAAAVAVWHPSGCHASADECSAEQSEQLSGARLESLSERLAPTVIRRVERLRGLRFANPPSIEVLGEHRLAALGDRLAQEAQARVGSPGSQAALHAKVGFLVLAGLYPNDLSFETTPNTVSEAIDGAYDYSTDRVVLVRGLLESRREVELTLAHELTHALEFQHYPLRLRFTAARHGEAADAREALIEGTATYVEARYLRHYLGDRVSIASRLRSSGVTISAEDEPPAVRARHVVQYVAGALFVRRLFLRGGWPLVDRALRHPPVTTSQIIHPSSWPSRASGEPVRLHLGPALASDRELAGGGVAGEDDVRFMILLGASQQDAFAASDGWRGGRFELWRLPGEHPDCQVACPEADVGVMGVRWRDDVDAVEFASGVAGYLRVGRLAEKVERGLWHLDDGFVATASAPHASGLAFAPTATLAVAVAGRAAEDASRSPRED
jgi:hypothetical protein